MRALGWMVVVAVVAGCECGPGPIVDAGSGGGTAATGGGSGGGVATGGGTGTEIDAGSDAGVTEDAGVDAGPVCPGVLVLTPALDFAGVIPGCVERQMITLNNPCASTEAVALLSAAPFFADAGTILIPPRTLIEVPVAFSPNALGPVTGVVSVSTAMRVLDVPVSGRGDNAPVTTDSFHQLTRPRENTLFVISDGPDMGAVQQLLAQNLNSYFQYATSNQYDFRVGVLAGRSNGGPLVGGVITPLTPDLQHVGNRVLLGTAGTPTVSCLERALQALSADRAWLIEGAGIRLICIQNTDEQLSQPAAQSLATLNGLLRPGLRLRVSAIGNFKPGCMAADDLALRSIVDATTGALSSICTPDFSALTASSGSGYAAIFWLSHPVTGAPAFTVAIDGQSIPPIDPHTGSSIWTWDPVMNAIIFAPLYVPEPGKTLTVTYASGCQP